MPQGFMQDFGFFPQTSETIWLIFLRLTLGVSFLAFTAATFYLHQKRQDANDPARNPLLLSVLVAGVGAILYGYLSLRIESLLFGTATDGMPSEPFYGEIDLYLMIARYAAWFVVLPLLLAMMVPHFLTLRHRKRLNLIFSLSMLSSCMLLCWFIGELTRPDIQGQLLWGTVGTAAYAGIAYMLFVKLWFTQAAEDGGHSTTLESFRPLLLFVVTGWGIYPLAYVTTALIPNPEVLLASQIAYSLADLANFLGPGFIIAATAHRQLHDPDTRPSVSGERATAFPKPTLPTTSS